MAEGNLLTGFVQGAQSFDILGVLMITLLGLVLLGIIGFWAYKAYQKKRYGEFKVVIWEADSIGNTHESYDRGGIFLDKKTGFKLLFLEKMKKGLNPNKVPFIPSKDSKGRLVKTIYLRKIGVSNYVFCHVKINDQGVAFSVGEEDVNWAAQDIEKIRRTFNKEGWLTKLAPYIMFIITIIVIMILMISLFGKFEALETISANMKEVTTLQANITQQLAQITNQTIKNQVTIPIITGGGQ